MSLMEHLQSWVDMGGKTSFPSSFDRLLLDSQKGGIPWCLHKLVTLAQMPCGMEKLKLDFMSSSPSLLQHRRDSPNPRDLSEPDPPKIGYQYVRQIGLSSVNTEMAFCGSSDWYRPHFHSCFLKGRVSLWKAVKQHAKCEQSALTLNLPCSEHHVKTSLGFVMAFWLWWSIEKGSLTVVYCSRLPMAFLKYHDCLWKVYLIELDTVWFGGKNGPAQTRKETFVVV